MTEKKSVTRADQISIFATALVACAGILSETSMNVTFPVLSQVFGLGLGTLQWITTGYLLAVAITISLGATLAHNWTERRILFTALGIFTLGNAIAVLAPNFSLLMLGRILQGGATGIAIPLMFNLVVNRVPREQIGLYMGLMGMVVSLAPAIGPTYGGVMIAHFDWHMIYTLILPVPILSFVLSFFHLKNSQPSGKRPFDLLSFLLLALSLTMSLVSISSLESGEGINWLYVLVFFGSLALFIWRSLTLETPFLDIRVLGRPVILFGILPFLLLQFVNLSANFLIPNFLVLVKQVSTVQAGFALLPGTLLGGLLAPVFGKIYDKFGAKLPLFGGNSVLLLDLALFSLLTADLSFPLVLGLYIFFTLGRNMAFNNTMAYSVSHVEKEKTADVTALFQLFPTFAGALGTSIAAILVNQAPSIQVGSQQVFGLLFLLVASNFVSYFVLFSAGKKSQ